VRRGPALRRTRIELSVSSSVQAEDVRRVLLEALVDRASEASVVLATLDAEEARFWVEAVARMPGDHDLLCLSLQRALQAAGISCRLVRLS
jgi:hypothetical protein